jgi:hypothetical protein
VIREYTSGMGMDTAQGVVVLLCVSSRAGKAVVLMFSISSLLSFPILAVLYPLVHIRREQQSHLPARYQHDKLQCNVSVKTHVHAHTTTTSQHNSAQAL